MNPTSKEEKKKIIKILNDADVDPNTEVVIAPPTLYIIPLVEVLRKDFKVAAQNAYIKTSGAFTGETSPTQLADAQVPYVILGHSERRTHFSETSELVAKKTRVAIDAGLSVILCIGETLEEREAGKCTEIVETQLKEVAKVVNEADWSKIVIAYEPVWAIGTGKVATTAQAQEAHSDIRAFLRSAVSPAVAENTRVIYGGSVNGGNCGELAKQPDVDGFLVGGASLKPEFVNIINSRRA